MGHIDGFGSVIASAPAGDNRVLTIGLAQAPELARYIAYKGSVTVDGVSLTVNSVSDPGETDPSFDLNIIPHTLAHTTLDDLVVGDTVNLEVDVLSRYLDRMMAIDTATGGAPAPR